MVPQIIQFLAERYEIHRRSFRSVQLPPPEIIRQTMVNEEGNLCIRLYELLDTSAILIDTIKEIQCFLKSVSLALDSPLTCSKIRFISLQHGKLLVANRRPITRGIAFEVEERETASNKIQNDLLFYQDETDKHIVVGRQHYLAGIQLLSLEDQIVGLIDAAFMQFYQGCEALCRDPRGCITGSKKYIATTGVKDFKELQIIAHQVWRVRHKYFGHGDVNFNLHSNLNKEHAMAVARQVLVSRYLCRRLLDINTPSKTHLIREMGLFSDSYSGNFRGTIEELENSFRVNFDARCSEVYNSEGEKVEKYLIK